MWLAAIKTITVISPLLPCLLLLLSGSDALATVGTLHNNSRGSYSRIPQNRSPSTTRHVAAVATHGAFAHSSRGPSAADASMVASRRKQALCCSHDSTRQLEADGGRPAFTAAYDKQQQQQQRQERPRPRPRRHAPASSTSPRTPLAASTLQTNELTSALTIFFATVGLALVPLAFLSGSHSPPSLSLENSNALNIRRLDGLHLARVLGAPEPAFAELAPLEKKTVAEQMTGNISPVNTVRGVWRVREARTDGSTLPQQDGRLVKGICKGRLSFKGFVGAGKGIVEYKGCGDRVGKGPWLTKPKNIFKGKITLSARWKLKFPDGASLLYRGDVLQDAEGTPLRVDAGGAAALGGNGFERPNAHIRGDVFKPVTTIQGTLTEKKIGEFEADLIELPRDTDKM